MDRVEVIAGVMAKHMHKDSFCACGWEPDETDEWPDQWCAHVASEIDKALPADEAKAELDHWKAEHLNEWQDAQDSALAANLGADQWRECAEQLAEALRGETDAAETLHDALVLQYEENRERRLGDVLVTVFVQRSAHRGAVASARSVLAAFDALQEGKVANDG